MLIKISAHVRGYRKAGWNRHSQTRHLMQASPLTAEEFAQSSIALGLAVAEKVNGFGFAPHRQTDLKRRCARLTESGEVQQLPILINAQKGRGFNLSVEVILNEIRNRVAHSAHNGCRKHNRCGRKILRMLKLY